MHGVGFGPAVLNALHRLGLLEQKKALKSKLNEREYKNVDEEYEIYIL